MPLVPKLSNVFEHAEKLSLSLYLRTNLEARGDTPGPGMETLHEELNNYSNYFLIDFPP
jgi:hypothetical protein